MSTFYGTFGTNYRREPHPSGKAINPDGWVEIEAPDYSAATEKMNEVYGHYWGDVYFEVDWDPRYFPDGCFARMRA